MLHIKNDYMHLSNDENDIPGFKTNAAAAICFVEAENKILLLKNKDADKLNSRQWGIPGGKLEKNENHLDAVKREIYEETKLEIPSTKLQYLFKSFVRIPDFDYELHLYRTHIDLSIKLLNIVLDPREHTTFLWVTIHESLEMPLIYGDKELIQYIYLK